MPYLSPALNVMIAAARKAGRGLVRDFGELEQLQVSMKGPADFVSVADERTERILIEEHIAYVEALMALSSGRYRVDGRRVLLG